MNRPITGTLNAIAERIRARLSRSAEDIVEIGQDLITAKAAVGHGHFLIWIDVQLEFIDRDGVA